MIPVISVVGYSNSGKTTFVVKLIKEFKKRGFKIATIKHHHKNIEMDAPGKDTWKHARAGADTVVLACPGQLGIFEKSSRELSLDEIVSRISGVDLIITEGYKKEDKPKIEVFRSEVHTSLISPPKELLAVASDTHFPDVPVFGLDDAPGLVDFLSEKLSLRSR
ncbi:molybdopterin-guanine dinucleotide biosynthesis protein B [Phosphitispora sp. TUW77]|uniref:molybdopterin-guanine dinucleotide biosynthesis protein B n=1 Tax=Phosphitispora sp. TUW77 TaxID=3152361 RepID=UPI003AB73215